MSEKEDMIVRVKELAAKRKQDILFIWVDGVLMFANLFFCVWLTYGKDIHEFVLREWIVFIVLMLFEAGIVVSLFVVANRYGKIRSAFLDLHYHLCDTAIEHSSLPAGNPIGVYAYQYKRRVVVMRVGNTDEVYFTVEQINAAYELEQYHTSEIYLNLDELQPMLNEMTDITEFFFDRQDETERSED